MALYAALCGLPVGYRGILTARGAFSYVKTGRYCRPTTTKAAYVRSSISKLSASLKTVGA